MTRLIDLTPTLQGGHLVRATHPLSISFEMACEYVEALGARPFTIREVFLSCYSMPATRQMLRFYLALNFIERVNGAGAKPAYYRVLPHALPKRAAA